VRANLIFRMFMTLGYVNGFWTKIISQKLSNKTDFIGWMLLAKVLKFR